MKGLGKRQRALINDLANNPERFIQVTVVFGKSSEITVSDDDLNDHYEVPVRILESLLRRKLIKESSHYGSMEHEVIRLSLCQ